MIERELIDAIDGDPQNAELREVYADWLEEQGDPRCHFVRQHLAVSPLPPDHPARRAGEEELSRARRGCDAEWLRWIEPERAHQLEEEVPRGCDCFSVAMSVQFHREPQDTECDAWKRLLDIVEAASSREGRFSPFRELQPEDRARIVTLPPTIARLTAITELDVYGSHFVRIPPEIGAMTALRTFTPYTSYRLHWFPYEITRCPDLRDSTVSTRALYGNFKHRYPFPALGARSRPARRPCSVCNLEFEDTGEHRVWISRRVATDVLPLLVNACSQACIDALPPSAEGYPSGPHRGGPWLVQPARH